MYTQIFIANKCLTDPRLLMLLVTLTDGFYWGVTSRHFRFGVPLLGALTLACPCLAWPSHHRVTHTSSKHWAVPGPDPEPQSQERGCKRERLLFFLMLARPELRGHRAGGQVRLGAAGRGPRCWACQVDPTTHGRLRWVSVLSRQNPGCAGFSGLRPLPFVTPSGDGQQGGKKSYCLVWVGRTERKVRGLPMAVSPQGPRHPLSESEVGRGQAMPHTKQ